MDIALHYFDEYVGDTLYSKLTLSNPFTSSLVNSASTPSVAALSSVLSSSLNSTLASPSSPSTIATLTSLLPKEALTFLSSLPSLTALPRDSIPRQCASLLLITYVGILLLYFSIATFSYYYIFDHRMKLHPRYLKNQVAQEIQFSLDAFPMLDLLTLPWFLGDVRGWSMLYDTIEEGPFGAQGGWKPWAYMLGSTAFFLLFTDTCIYWVHRWLHIPFLYKRLHKPHHKWVIPTPFASHAFHPVDGYLQSVPYHLCCYLIPIHKYLFIGLFSAVNFWSIFIHDSELISDSKFENYINGPSHHTLHHMFFTCNYGQYFTLSDKLGGSFRAPQKGEDPLLAVLAAIEEKKLRESGESSSCGVSEVDSMETNSEVESEGEGVSLSRKMQ